MLRTTLILALTTLIPSILAAQPAAFQRANEAGQRGDWPAAIQAYRDHLATNPQDAWGWYALGAVLHGTGSFTEAADAFQSSLDNNVSAPPVVHYNLACSLARNGDFDEALDNLADAIPSGLFSGKSIREDPDFASLRSLERFTELADQGDLANRPCLLKPAYRKIDFWIGTWDVRITGGFKAGTSRVERSEDGCVVTQHWEGVFGSRGRTWTYYDEARDVWTQNWVGSAGVVAPSEGHFEGDDLVLTGPGATGPTSRARTRFAPEPDGSLTVTSWTSEDSGATWSVPAVTRHFPAEAGKGAQ